MNRKAPFCSYKETRVDLEPLSLGSTVAIQLPLHGTSIFPSRTAQKRPHIVEHLVAEDEETFRKRHLATASSVYHRAHHGSPRSFLWRILEDGKVLSVQPVDICRDTTKQKMHVPAAKSKMTLHLALPSPVLPSCVAFSDSREHDILSVFILTESYHLYTLTLRPEHFQKSQLSEGNVGDWCKSYISSAFSFKHPLRLVALTADDILVSLIDGGLLKLSRKSGGDGTEWREVFYNEGGWSHSLRSLIPFQGNNTVHHGKHNIELSAVISIASPNVEIRGFPFAFTVSIDHRLRVWNLNSGKLAYMKDMLTGELDLNDPVKKVIDPSLSQLVKVFGSEEYPLVVTYSPLGTGEFKFWRPRLQDDGSFELDDLFRGISLQPRAPSSSDVWTLADFSVIVGKASMSDFQMWILWKNNTTHRTQSLDFRTGSSARNTWSDGWKAMASETMREAQPPVSFAADTLDVSDKWLEFLLAPGRYTTATIETGLAIMKSNSGSEKSTTRKSESLPEKMCSVVASSNILERASDGSMDFDQLRAALEQQWLRFYRLLQELNKQREEAQSLAIDPRGNMPCIVLSDGIIAIRICSELEQLWHNPDALFDGNLRVRAPILAAAQFRDGLAEGFLHNCKSMLLGEIYEEPLLADPARMRAFYEKCGFENQIDDESFIQLVEKLREFESGWKDLTPTVFEAVLKSLSPADGKAGDLQTASFGDSIIVRATQEIVELHRNICLDQMLLIVLIEAEINHSEDGLQFETADVFDKLVAMLKRLELISWLTSTQIWLPYDEEEKVKGNESLQKSQSGEVVTVFEGVFRHLFTLSKQAMPLSVTQLVLQICASNTYFEVHPATVQCFLLKHSRPDLALEFARFASRDPFSTYILGRTLLASNDLVGASALFQKAAFGISYSNPKNQVDVGSSGYFTNERDYLHGGLPLYYSHIAALYEIGKHYSFVADFARLSLQFTKLDDRDHDLRSDMQNRLFTASIYTCRFETAYSILMQFTNQTLQDTALRTLITKMCEQSFASELVQLPFVGLHDQVDEFLAQKCSGIVDVLAGVPYHKILYAWRIKHNDFRGAAAISLSRLQRLVIAGNGDKPIIEDSSETPVTQQYVNLINVLSCVDSDQAWILNEAPLQKGRPSKNAEQPKRRVVTLNDIRKEYQAELDRIAAIANNQFAFGDGDEMDVL